MVTDLDAADYADEALRRRAAWFDGIVGLALAMCEAAEKDSEGVLAPCEACVSGINAALCRLFGVTP